MELFYLPSFFIVLLLMTIEQLLHAHFSPSLRYAIALTRRRIIKPSVLKYAITFCRPSTWLDTGQKITFTTIPEFDPRSDHVVFVVDELTLLRFQP
jgi:hypothetical protein